MGMPTALRTVGSSS